MSPSLVALLIALVDEAPTLVAKLLAIWSNKGLLTPEEIATFISTKWPDAEGFFHPAVTP